MIEIKNKYTNSIILKINAELVIAQTVIVAEGALIVWKLCLRENGQTAIIKLRVPEEARRSNSRGRKCRFEFVDVLDDGGEPAFSIYDKTTMYITGQRVICHQWDENRWNECSGGIHAFLTREEAENYQ